MSREQEIAELKTTLSLDTGDFKKELSKVSKETTGLKKSFDIASKSIDNAEDSIEATNKAISRGEKAMESMNKKLELQKKRYDDLKSIIDKQSKSYNELSNKLSDAEKELITLEQAENKSTDSIEKQKSAIEELRKQLSNKSQLIDKNINKLQTYSNDIDKTENDITSLGNQLGKLKNSLEDVAESTETVYEASESGGSSLEGFKDLAGEAGVDLGLLELSAKGAAAALAVVITKSVIDAAGTYDKAITDLEITMGITEDSAKDLYSAIRDIADGGYSIEGISEAVKMLEQRFGLSAEESEELAQGIDLLNKYGYESKDVIRFMTSAVKDWGMEYEEALDYILKGEQEGLNISADWLDVLAEYTPWLASLGVSGNDAFLLMQEAINTTGVETDKAADMVKEFFLKFTEGSDSTKEVFSDLGLNLEELQKQVDDGSITSVDAMKRVMQAIMDVGSETKQSEILQTLFAGTVEYGSIGIIEAWANVGDEVIETTGTIDAAKEAFEGSYEAAKQDLSNSWNDLTETVGSKVVPMLTWVVDILNDLCIGILNIGPLMKNTFALMGNDVAQWTLGAVGKIQEFEIACIESAIKIAEALGKDEWAEKWETNLDRAKTYHSQTVDKIIENENKRTQIEQEDQTLREQIFGRDRENHTKTADTIIQNNENIKKSSSETNKKLDTDSTNAANKVSQSANKIGTDMSTNLNKAKTSAESSMSGVKNAVNNNMDGSLRTVQVQATEMYKGVKTSFHKMSQSAREDGTEMYKGVQTSAQKMASSAKSSATDMYRGVTNSTTKMANQAIADWNRIRSAYSNPINAKITTTKTTITKTQSARSIDSPPVPLAANVRFGVNTVDLNNIVTRGSYFSSSTGNSKIASGSRSIESFERKLEVAMDYMIRKVTPIVININDASISSGRITDKNDLRILAKDLAEYMTEEIARRIRRTRL